MRFTTVVLAVFLLVACASLSASPPTVIPATVTPTFSPTDASTPFVTSTPSLTPTPQRICLKIMPLGDSITVGEKDLTYGGYRHLLWTLLTDDGYVIDYVGSQQNGKQTMSDPDHEGHSGWKIQNIINGINSNNWLKTYQPNLILLHIGSNDIRLGRAATAPEKLSTLLDIILQRLPETHVIVAQVVPFAGGFIHGHYTYNEAIPAIVASKGPRVSLVDMRDILSPGDFGDSYHPTDDGYDKMARAWEQAILQVDWKSMPGLACAH